MLGQLDTGLIEHVGTGDSRVVRHRVSGRDNAKVVMRDDGYWIVDYLKWNITAAEGRALSERGREGGLASGVARSARGEPHPEVERHVEQDVEPDAYSASNRQVRSSQVQSGETDQTLALRAQL